MYISFAALGFENVTNTFNQVLEVFIYIFESVIEAFNWASDAIVSFITVIASFGNIPLLLPVFVPSELVPVFTLLITVSIGFAVLSFFGSSVRS